MNVYKPNWTGKRYFWYVGKLKIKVNYWLYERTPMRVFGRGYETTKYDRPHKKNN